MSMVNPPSPTQDSGVARRVHERTPRGFRQDLAGERLKAGLRRRAHRADVAARPDRRRSSDDEAVEAARVHDHARAIRQEATMKTKTYAAAIALASIVAAPGEADGIVTGKGIYLSCKRPGYALFRGCGEVLCFRDAFYDLDDDDKLLCKWRGRVRSGHGWFLVRARG
jgi:hypothetical protein